MLGPKARRLTTIKAGNPYEARTLYNQIMGWEPYTTDGPCDYEPYPEEWLREQEQEELSRPVPEPQDPPP
jgi:hypothetical protein